MTVTYSKDNPGKISTRLEVKSDLTFYWVGKYVYRGGLCKDLIDYRIIYFDQIVWC